MIKTKELFDEAVSLPVEIRGYKGGCVLICDYY